MRQGCDETSSRNLIAVSSDQDDAINLTTESILYDLNGNSYIRLLFLAKGTESVMGRAIFVGLYEIAFVNNDAVMALRCDKILMPQLFSLIEAPNCRKQRNPSQDLSFAQK